MSYDLSKKTVLVTGAGKGIGFAICKQLSNAGANVIAVARSAEQLAQLQKECIPNAVQTIQVDLKDWEQTRTALANVPRLDGLVNNAGVAIIKPFEEMTEADFDDTFNVNIKAVFNVTQKLADRLNVGASIVMVSSLAATRSFIGHTVYSATKAAIDSLTRSLALELSPRRVRVNSVNPTVVLTKMGKDNWSDPKKAEPLLNHIPLHRFCEVSEVCDGVLFLLSDRASFINGHHLNLEGGYSVQ